MSFIKGKRTYSFLIILLFFFPVKCLSDNRLDEKAYVNKNGVNKTNKNETIFIFTPELEIQSIQKLIDIVYAVQKNNQFGKEHCAFLFMPGTYKDLDIKIGYNTQVLGLGKSPDDVNIIGSVHTDDLKGAGALCNFWRGIENISITSIENDCSIWAVSQGASMRRVHIRGSLKLWDKGLSSGGFLANSKIDGTISSGTQEQWLTRNSFFSKWNGGRWNMIFVGSEYDQKPSTSKPLLDNWKDFPYTFINKTPIVAEKPYLRYLENNYEIVVPCVKKLTSGFDWDDNDINSKIYPLSKFYIANPEDSAEILNNALKLGMNLLLTPGVYSLDKPIMLTRPNTIILGLGIPVLISEKGNAVIETEDLDGLRIAGILIQAGSKKTKTLIKIGTGISDIDHTKDPTVLSDIYVRIGGVEKGLAENCLTINNNDVICDNLWLWRADHGKCVGWSKNPCDNGITVNGNNVTAYGLAVEHFEKFQTVWNGESGKTFFYQSELPYDIPDQSSWKQENINGFASYKLASFVKFHEAYGLGIYSFFRDSDNIIEECSISSPLSPNIKFLHMINIWLNGKPSSYIKHIINNSGKEVNSTNRKSTLSTWPVQ